MKTALRHSALCALAAMMIAAIPHHASAQDDTPLVADIDREIVRITTDFTGARLLLFGALDLEDGDDIAIAVTGPDEEVAIRRKNRVAGIWLNTEQAILTGVPSFYHILSTRPIPEIATTDVQGAIRLGYEHIPFTLRPGSRIDEGDEAEWKDALRRNMESQGLWRKEVDEIGILQNALFRTDVVLPTNVHPGDYTVRILHFRDGVVINEDISSIEVRKTGISARIFGFAHNYAPYYGIFAILFAGLTGWLAAVAFRR